MPKSCDAIVVCLYWLNDCKINIQIAQIRRFQLLFFVKLWHKSLLRVHTGRQLEYLQLQMKAWSWTVSKDSYVYFFLLMTLMVSVDIMVSILDINFIISRIT